jgi:hypothetical protein
MRTHFHRQVEDKDVAIAAEPDQLALGRHQRSVIHFDVKMRPHHRCAHRHPRQVARRLEYHGKLRPYLGAGLWQQNT